MGAPLWRPFAPLLSSLPPQTVAAENQTSYLFLLTESGRARMAGIERADSITLDPHKGLFLPYGTGCLLVRDGEALKRAHEVSAHYMPTMQEDPDLVDFCQISSELSRDWRGLRVWLPVKMHGIGPFERNLEEKLELTRWATEELRGIHGIEILAEPQLSIAAFRLARPGLDDAALNALNRSLLERINQKKRVYLTGPCFPAASRSASASSPSARIWTA